MNTIIIIKHNGVYIASCTSHGVWHQVQSVSLKLAKYLLQQEIKSHEVVTL